MCVRSLAAKMSLMRPAWTGSGGQDAGDLSGMQWRGSEITG